MRAFRQGRLDQLCGTYAVVNAIRCAIARQRRLTASECAELFGHLIGCLDERGRLMETLTNGMSGDTAATLLRDTDSWLRQRQKARLHFQRPFHPRPNVSVDALTATLEEHLSTPDRAAILAIQLETLHWTVVRRLTPQTLLLCDSIGITRLNRRRIHIQAKRGQGYQLVPKDLFLLKVRRDGPGVRW